MWQIDRVAKNLFSPLLLSYYDLPLPLRQCFSYCAIFPKDHVIEKDLLIKLWMAQGFLGEGNEMEIVGEEYFDNLATRSFQEFEKDLNDDSIIVRCKMHDIVQDFAQLLRKTECCIVARGGIEERGAEFCHENVRHLTLICDDHYDVGIPDPIYNFKKLRSLFIKRFYSTPSWEASLPKLFDQLTCLRMLDLSKSSIKSSFKDLPQEMGKLIHLRYLCLEGNEYLSKLPETLCDLLNLQTLNIRRCCSLTKLPCGMEKLINLRHLQNACTSRLSMPKGMQRLACLQTLEEFYVVKKGERGNIESETSFSLADLGKLNQLRHLEIIGLGNVREASEASEARLSTKIGLHSLILNFDGDYDEEQPNSIEDEAFLLQALHPPKHLQVLRIIYYSGPVFPNWMKSLALLKRIELCWCDNWESLPPVGNLPSLESLRISCMEKVKKVGDEFLGVGTSYSSFNHNIAFPNLKRLEFYSMFEWEEWEYEEVLRSRGVDDSSPPSNITIVMPKLQRLFIENCPKLKKLPLHLLQSIALQELKIISCAILHSTRDDWPSISHIPIVTIRSK